MGSLPERYPRLRRFFAYSSASLSDMASACTRRTAVVAKTSFRAGAARSVKALRMAAPRTARSTGRPRSAEIVGATSYTVALPRGSPRFTRAPQAAKTPSIRCQKAAVAGFSDERSHGRSAPHLNP